MTMMTESRQVMIAFVAFLTALCGGAQAAHAQSVSDVLGFLITNRSVETGDFDRDRAAAQATSETISRILLANLATLPVTSSSSAFVYRLNPALGTEERATATFAPFMVERALTAGRHQASLALTLQHLRFTTLDGRKLRDGTLVTTANQFVDEPVPFDVDQLAVNIDSSIATLHGSFGVTERMEIGFAVPTVRLRVNGDRVNVYRGQTFTQARASATAVGFADTIVRAKYLLYDDGGTRTAVAGAFRLPTGRQVDLLGAGTTSLKVSAIESFEGRFVSTHLNVGFTVGGLAPELSYGGALAVAVARSLTASGEVVGRWLDDTGELVTSTAPHPRLVGVVTQRLLANDSAVNLITLVPGLKWNVRNTWVIAANVAIPLRDAGLVSPVTPFLGLDYTF
jgi:hypothetical protein